MQADRADPSSTTSEGAGRRRSTAAMSATDEPAGGREDERPSGSCLPVVHTVLPSERTTRVLPQYVNYIGELGSRQCRTRRQCLCHLERGDRPCYACNLHRRHGARSHDSRGRVPQASTTRTVERALALLAEVCTHDSITLAECARATSLPPSTALRLLRTLESAGLRRARQDGALRRRRPPAPARRRRARPPVAGRGSPSRRCGASSTRRGESTYLVDPGPGRHRRLRRAWSRAPTRCGTPAGSAARSRSTDLAVGAGPARLKPARRLRRPARPARARRHRDLLAPIRAPRRRRRRADPCSARPIAIDDDTMHALRRASSAARRVPWRRSSVHRRTDRTG